MSQTTSPSILLDQIPLSVPSNQDLRLFREALGISQNELASALGFGPNGGKTVRDWEQGYRDSAPFVPTRTAWTAFQGLMVMVSIYRTLGLTDPQAVLIRRLLPNCLQ